MKQTQNRIDHHIDLDALANLSRIHLTQEEKNELLPKLDSILEYCDKISKIDTAGIEPSAHSFPVYNVLREDIPGETLEQQTILRNAPEHENVYIVVPKILD